MGTSTQWLQQMIASANIIYVTKSYKRTRCGKARHSFAAISQREMNGQVWKEPFSSGSEDKKPESIKGSLGGEMAGWLEISNSSGFRGCTCRVLNGCHTRNTRSHRSAKNQWIFACPAKRQCLRPGAVGGGGRGDKREYPGMGMKG